MSTLPNTGPPFTSTGCCFVGDQTVTVTPEPFWCSAVQMKHQASLAVRASSTVAAGGVGCGWWVGGQGSQSTSVQQVADKVPKSSKTGSPSQVSVDPRGLVLKCVGRVGWEPQKHRK